MAEKIDTDKIVRVLVLALVVLFLITQIIDFNGITTGNPFRENIDYANLVPKGFTYLMVGIVAYLAWRLGTGSFADMKQLLPLLLVGVALYFMYNYFLAPQLGLPTIEYGAYMLQSMMP